MQHYDSGRVQRHYLLEANADGAVDLFRGFFSGEGQLIVLIAQQFFEFLEFEAVAVHHQFDLLLRVLLAVVGPHCGLVVVQQEVPFRQDARLLQVVCLAGVVGEAADHDALVDVVHLADLRDYPLADHLALQEEVVLAPEERAEVDEAEVVLVGQRKRQSAPLFLVKALDADDHLRVAVLQVLDQVGDGVFGAIEQQSLGEFSEEMADLVLLDVGLDLLVALEGLFSVHCSYITRIRLRKVRSSCQVLAQAVQDAVLLLPRRLLLGAQQELLGVLELLGYLLPLAGQLLVTGHLGAPRLLQAAVVGRRLQFWPFLVGVSLELFFEVVDQVLSLLQLASQFLLGKLRQLQRSHEFGVIEAVPLPVGFLQQFVYLCAMVLVLEPAGTQLVFNRGYLLLEGELAFHQLPLRRQQFRMQFFDFRVMSYSEVVELHPALLVYLVHLMHQLILPVVQIVYFPEFLVEQGVHSLQLALQVYHYTLQLLVPSRFLQLLQVFLAVELQLLRQLSLPSLQLAHLLLVILEIGLRAFMLWLRQLLFEALYFLPKGGVFELDELHVFFVVVCRRWFPVSFSLKRPKFLLKFPVEGGGIIVSPNQLFVDGLMPLQFQLICGDHSLRLYLLSQQSLVILPQLLVVLLVFSNCLLQLLVQLLAPLKLIVGLRLHEVECFFSFHLHRLHLLVFSLGKLGFEPFCSQDELFLFSLQAGDRASELL